MHISRIPWQRSRAIIATVAGIALGVQGLSAPALAADEEEIANISDGYVDWGIKQSWRQYVGDAGITVRDGVTKNADGTYRWPITAGTYDAANETLELNLGGEVQFESHCEEPDSCLLDSTFSDMKLVISPGSAYIQADYAGVLMEDWDGGVQYFDDAHIATLDYQNASYQRLQSGWSDYAGIEVIAGPGLLLYAEGTPLDGVEIGYNGPGGIPEFVSALNPGVPVFEDGARWDSGIADSEMKSGWRIFASENHDVVYQVDSQNSAETSGGYRIPEVTVRALDAKTLVELNSTTYRGAADTDGRFSLSNIVFDPKTDTIYAAYPQRRQANAAFGIEGLGTTVVATSFNGSEFSVNDNYAHIDGVSYADYPRMSFLPGRNELALVSQGENAKLIRISGPGEVSVADLAVDELCQDVDYDWDDEAEDIVEIFVNPTENVSQENNDSNRFLETTSGMTRFWAEGGITRNAHLVNYDFTATPPTMECVPNFTGGTWNRSNLPSYTSFKQLGDGNYLVYGAYGGYTAVENTDTGLVPRQNHAALQYFEVNGPEFTASTTDLARSYLFAPLESKIWVFGENASPVRTFLINDVTNATQLVNRTGIAVTRDGSIVYPDFEVKDGKVSNGLRLLQYRGDSLTFDAEPESKLIRLEQTESEKLSFHASVATSTGNTQLQWQIKEPKSLWFTNIPGETGETLSVIATRELDGAQYRLTATDDMGTAATVPATLQVVARPSFTHEPEDITVDAGEEIRFFANADGNPEPVMGWQEFVDGQWRMLYPEAGLTEDNMGDMGTTITISNISEAWHGRTIRAIARNDYGDVPSRSATITINGVFDDAEENEADTAEESTSEESSVEGAAEESSVETTEESVAESGEETSTEESDVESAAPSSPAVSEAESAEDAMGAEDTENVQELTTTNEPQSGAGDTTAGLSSELSAGESSDVSAEPATFEQPSETPATEPSSELAVVGTEAVEGSDSAAEPGETGESDAEPSEGEATTTDEATEDTTTAPSTDLNADNADTNMPAANAGNIFRQLANLLSALIRTLFNAITTPQVPGTDATQSSSVEATAHAPASADAAGNTDAGDNAGTSVLDESSAEQGTGAQSDAAQSDVSQGGYGQSNGEPATEPNASAPASSEPQINSNVEVKVQSMFGTFNVLWSLNLQLGSILGLVAFVWSVLLSVASLSILS